VGGIEGGVGRGLGPVDVGGRVVDEDVEASRVGLEGGDRACDAASVRDVEGDGERPYVITQVADGVGGPLRVARGDEDVGARVRELSRDLEPEAVGGTGDECDRTRLSHLPNCNGPFRIIPSVRLSREDRERIVLDTAARLFYARGVHEVGMDEFVRETGLGKATVYRLFPTKDLLVAAYLGRLATGILAEIDRQATDTESPAQALHELLAAIEADLARPGFRGCAFNNASIEFDDPSHPARVAARDYRRNLHARMLAAARQLLPEQDADAVALAGRLATLVDGAHTSAAHLGPDGPAAHGLALAHELVDAAGTRARSDTLGAAPP
jgi:AcrR family transcriptional regulator